MRQEKEIDLHEGGSGRDSLAGYEYQMDVSVWLALDLLLASKQAHELVLEPSSQEDLESQLEDYEPSYATSSVPLKSYLLVAQAKLRSGDAWTVAGIKALLKYGGKGRKSAAERLADPDIRYLLVTSAPLNGKAKGLKIRRPGVWPKACEMPVSIRNALPPGRPDPWSDELDKEVKQSRATALCVSCLCPQDGHYWLCPNCGFP